MITPLEMYIVHPDIPNIIAPIMSLPTSELDSASMLRLGNIMYGLWQYINAYRIQDVNKPVETQRQLAALSDWLRDRSVLLRRYYGSALGSIQLSLTVDAQTQMNNILSRDPIVAFDFDIANACLRMVAGISIK